MLFYVKQNCPRVESFWINDKYEDLISFWKTVQDDKKLCALLSMLNQAQKMTLANKISLCQDLKNTNTYNGVISSAYKFFVLNRCSFSGTTEAGGLSKHAMEHRFTESSIDRLVQAQTILKDVKITLGDYSILIDEPGEDVLIYLDRIPFAPGACHL